MNGPEIQHLIETDLRRAMARRGRPPHPAAAEGSAWLMMSALQKGIRRGREDLALSAAATLLRDAPERLWRRLGCIAAEDVGLGSLDAMGLATAAMTGKRLRAELGGDWAVASCVVGELARAPKCRAADDLLMSCQLHPAYARVHAEQRGLSSRELIAIVTGKAEVHERALALWRVLGGGPRSLYPGRRGETLLVFDQLCEAGWPHSVVEIARQNFRRAGEPLAAFVALLSQELNEAVKVEADGFPPETMIGDIPSWSFDIYSREGRAAYGRFLQTDAPSALWVSDHVTQPRRIAFLGNLVFRVEGGLVDFRMRWPLSDRLRREVDIECAGRECRDATELLEIVRADIPRLNQVREEALGSRSHA